jgi:hypothetical protein
MKKIIFALLIPVFLTACSAIGSKKSSLKVGMSKEEVISLLGEPIKNEKYCVENVFFYYDGHSWRDGSITSDECFPLVFENGKLIGWGKEFYQPYRKKDWEQ